MRPRNRCGFDSVSSFLSRTCDLHQAEQSVAFVEGEQWSKEWTVLCARRGRGSSFEQAGLKRRQDDGSVNPRSPDTATTNNKVHDLKCRRNIGKDWRTSGSVCLARLLGVFHMRVPPSRCHGLCWRLANWVCQMRSAS